MLMSTDRRTRHFKPLIAVGIALTAQWTACKSTDGKSSAKDIHGSAQEYTSGYDKGNIPFNVKQIQGFVNESTGEICGVVETKHHAGNFGPQLTMYLPKGQTTPPTSDSRTEESVLLIEDKKDPFASSMKNEIFKLASDLDDDVLRRNPVATFWACAKLGTTSAFWYSKYYPLPFVPVTSLRVTNASGGPKSSEGCLVVKEPGKFGNPHPTDSSYDCCPDGQWKARGQRGGVKSGCSSSGGSDNSRVEDISNYYKGNRAGEPSYEATGRSPSPYCTYGNISDDLYQELVQNEEECFTRCSPNRQGGNLKHVSCFNNFCIGFTKQLGQEIKQMGDGRSLRVCVY